LGTIILNLTTSLGLCVRIRNEKLNNNKSGLKNTISNLNTEESINQNNTDFLSESVPFQELFSSIKETGENIHIHGLAGSFDSILVAHLAKETQSSQTVVLRDRDEAIFFVDDLKKIYSEEILYFFFI